MAIEVRWSIFQAQLTVSRLSAHVRCTLITTMNGETLLNVVCEVVGDNLPKISKIDAGGVLNKMSRSYTTRHRPGKFDCQALPETGCQLTPGTSSLYGPFGPSEFGSMFPILFSWAV